MSVVSYFDGWDPYRRAGGERRPVVRVWGRLYEFRRRGEAWVQAPGISWFLHPMSTRPERTERKRLTPYQVRKVNRLLRRYP